MAHDILVHLSKVDARAHLDATLALGAACIYMLNACFTHPAEGFGLKSLIDTAHIHLDTQFIGVHFEPLFCLAGRNRKMHVLNSDGHDLHEEGYLMVD
jgi:hypothetical protein